MSKRGSLLVMLLAAGAVVGGWQVFRFRATQPPEQSLARATDFYQQGARAEGARQFGDAAEFFDKSSRLAADLVAVVGRQRGTDKRLTPEQDRPFKELLGQAHWLRYQALRDGAYAHAQANGKPAPEQPDSATGEKFRTIMVAPQAQDREDASRSLRYASFLLPGHEEVLREALRNEVQLRPMNWTEVHRLAQAVLNLAPQDVRALTFLARYDLEQPASGAPEPSPPDKRSRVRVQQSLTAVERLRRAPNVPPWRPLLLEAQVCQWLADDAARRDDATEHAAQTARLRALYFEAGGVLALCRAEGNLQRVGAWDAESILGLLPTVVARAAGDAPPQKQADPSVASVTKDCLAFLARIDPARAAAFSADKRAVAAVRILAIAQPALLQGAPSAWDDAAAQARGLVREAEQVAADKALTALAGGQFGALLIWTHLANPPATAGKDSDERCVEGLKMLEQALQTVGRIKSAGEIADELHASAADAKFALGKSAGDLEPHLQALAGSSAARWRDLAALLSAAQDERAGKLRSARQRLVTIPDQTDPSTARRAHLLLGPLQLTLGQPDLAVASLQEALRAQAAPRLPLADQKWFREHYPDPNDLPALFAMAQFGVADGRLQRFRLLQPKQAPPRDLSAKELQNLDLLVRQMPVQARQRPLVLQLLARLQILAGESMAARATLSALARQGPAAPDAIQSEIELRLLEAEIESAGKKSRAALELELVPTVDKLMQQSLTAAPADASVRMLSLLWLVRTGRSKQAATSLQEAYPALPPASAERLRTLAELALGLESPAGRPGPSAISRELASSLLFLVDPRPERFASLPTATARHCELCTARFWNGAEALRAGRAGDAATAFTAALEHAAVRPAAEIGLNRAKKAK